MDTFSAIEQRRSVKHYDPDHEIPEHQIKQLISLGMLSPTSFNIQNWRFVVVRDPEVRQEVKAASWNQAQVSDASLLLLICADLRSWEKDPARYWRNAPEQVQSQMVGMIPKFYIDDRQLERDEAMRSCGIASQTIMLAAKSMGYDSCPMIGFDPLKVSEIINLPDDHVIGMMLVVGKAAKPARSRGGQLSIDEVCVTDRF